MKKLLLFPLLVAVSLTLGGCLTTGSVLERIAGLPAGVLTTTINNPVGPRELADIERGYQAALGISKVYVELCRTRQLARASCRPVVERIQSYVGQAHRALVQLRKFVRNNDTINAMSALAAVRQAIAGFQRSPDFQAIQAAGVMAAR
jgi:hypothetical protein